MKYGRLPSNPDRPKLHFSNYVDLSAFKVPKNFGHYAQVPDYGMLANDRYGCCAFAGSAHEVMVENAANHRTVSFTDDDVLSDYAAVTGFSPNDPSTDRGTDVHTLAQYRLNTGIVDSTGNRHKVAAYMELEPGNIDELAAATYLFGAVGIGIVVHDWTEQQFERGKPWSYRMGGQVLGGHYVPVVGRSGAYWEVVTWGKLQLMTSAFYEQQNEETFVFLSEDYLTGDKSPEGFDRQALLNDLPAIQRLK